MLTLSATAATPLRAMVWLWYLLALHPWADDLLADELDRVLGDRTPMPDDLPNSSICAGWSTRRCGSIRPCR